MKHGIRVAHVATVDLTLGTLVLPQLRALRDAGFEVLAVSAPGPLVRRVQAEGIQHVEWRNATRSWHPWADVRAFGELITILRRERPHLVHTHTAKPGVMGRIAARVVGTPCVVNTVHGFDAPPDDALERRLAFMSLEWLAARFSDLELYQAAADLERARKIRMVDRRKGVFLGNGTDLAWFDPKAVSSTNASRIRRRLGFAPKDVVFGTVGRLVAEKGYRELFEAARFVRARSPEVRFLAIGGPDASKADAIGEAELRRACEDVVFTGWRDDVRDLLAAIDVFVLPSWREGLPRSAIEAAAMGRPLLLSDIPGCREVCRHGIEGLLVPPRDARSLAEAVSTLAGSDDLRSRMGGAALTRAAERFDEARVLQVLLREYDRLLRRRSLVQADGAGPSGAQEERWPANTSG